MTSRVWPLCAIALSLAPSLSNASASRVHCQLNDAVNVTELSLCGEADWAEIVVSDPCVFDKYRFVLGQYSRKTGAAEAKWFKTFPARVRRDTFGSVGPQAEYVTINSFRTFPDAPRLRDRHVEWGDVEWVAFCAPRPMLSSGKPWDEQFNPAACTGFTNVGVPKRPCTAVVRDSPTWGRPAFDGERGVPPYGTIAPLGGSCELERWSKKEDNWPCYASPTRTTCKTSEVLINEVDGEAIRSGADWVEIHHVETAAGACELRGCQLIFSQCDGASCVDITPYPKSRFVADVRPGDYHIFMATTDFVAPERFVDYIPARPTNPLTVALCCESGFEEAWSGDPSRWASEPGACTTLSGIGSTSKHLTWGRDRDRADGPSVQTAQTKRRKNSPEYTEPCALNHGINVTEISFCGAHDWVEVTTVSRCDFAWYSVVLGKYDCETGEAIKTHVHLVADSLLGDRNDSVEYLVFEGFVHIGNQTKADVNFGDVDFVVRAQSRHSSVAARKARSPHVRARAPAPVLAGYLQALAALAPVPAVGRAGELRLVQRPRQH